MKVENVNIEKQLGEEINMSISEIIPYIRNNKIHDKEQINRIANSINEFWFTQRIVVDKDNVIIIWHWRLEAAKKLWLKEVPVLRMNDLSEKQVSKLRILDNKLNESDWDVLNLKEELEGLEDMNFGDLEFNKEDLFPELFEEPEEKVKEDKPEVEFTEELWEESNYLVLYFDNSIDWINAQSIFDLKPVKALDSKKWYERVWVGRVINGTKFIEKILDAENKGLWK